MKVFQLIACFAIICAVRADDPSTVAEEAVALAQWAQQQVANNPQLADYESPATLANLNANKTSLDSTIRDMADYFKDVCDNGNAYPLYRVYKYSNSHSLYCCIMKDYCVNKQANNAEFLFQGCAAFDHLGANMPQLSQDIIDDAANNYGPSSSETCADLHQKIIDNCQDALDCLDEAIVDNTALPDADVANYLNAAMAKGVGMAEHMHELCDTDEALCTVFDEAVAAGGSALPPVSP